MPGNSTISMCEKCGVEVVVPLDRLRSMTRDAIQGYITMLMQQVDDHANKCGGQLV